MSLPPSSQPSLPSTSKTDKETAQCDKMETLKNASRVLIHSEIKALQMGASAGLLVAIPSLCLFPMRANASDVAPVVAAASIAGHFALCAAGVVLPLATAKLFVSGKEGVKSRADSLRANRRQNWLHTVGGWGSVGGVIVELVRMRSVARLRGVAMGSLVDAQGGERKAWAWEIFCFSVVGATTAVAVPTVVAYFTGGAAKDDRLLVNELNEEEESIKVTEEEKEESKENNKA